MKDIETLLYPGIDLFRSLPENESFLNTHNNIQKFHIDCIKLFQLFKVNVTYNGLIFKKFTLRKDLLLKNDQGPLVYLNWKGILNIFFFSKKHSLPTNKFFGIIHNVYSHSYYHWLLEALPRLYLTQKHGFSFTLLLPKDHQEPFHLESLKLFGIREIEYMEPKTLYRIPHLLSVSQIGRMANYHPEVLMEFAEFIKSQFHLNKNLGERIYISRAKASKRKVINEEEVINFLQLYNFKKVYLEDHTFEEQVSIMHHCRYLVSIHGAGLANMIFMKQGSSVFELRKDDGGINYFFYGVAGSCRHRYFFQFCQSPDSRVKVQDADIWVDIATLKKNLNLMFK